MTIELGDISGLSLAEAAAACGEAVQNALQRYLEEEREHLLFEQHYLVAVTLTAASIVRSEQRPFIESVFKDQTEKFLTRFAKNTPAANQAFVEIQLVRYYQSFEAYLGDCWGNVYFYFPRFLQASTDDARVGP